MMNRTAETVSVKRLIPFNNNDMLFQPLILVLFLVAIPATWLLVNHLLISVAITVLLLVALTFVYKWISRIYGFRTTTKTTIAIPVADAAEIIKLKETILQQDQQVTALRSAKEENELRIWNLEQILEAQDTYIKTAIHEMNNPITCLTVSLQMAEILMKENDTRQAIRYITKATTQVSKFNLLLHELLTAPGSSADKSLQLKPVEVDELVQDCIEHISDQYKTHRFHFEGVHGLLINADQMKIERALSNLLSNAAKYSDPGSTIMITTNVADTNTEIIVKDNGIGIPREKLPYIFNRYYRVKDNAEKVEGYGLGLYIVSEIVKEHNGKIWAESEPGNGSTFHILLPAVIVNK
jgi:signal transduction histidine kinase